MASTRIDSLAGLIAPVVDPDAPDGMISYEVLTRLRDRDGALIQPPEFLTLLRDLCVVDTTRAERELSYRPRHDIQGTLRAFAAAL